MEESGDEVSKSRAGVGRSGSLPLPSSTPELVNMSPMSQPISHSQHKQAVDDALKKREWLHSQKIRLQVELAALQNEATQEAENLSERELEEKHESLKEALMEKTLKVSTTEYIFRRSQLDSILTSVMQNSTSQQPDQKTIDRQREIEGLLAEYTSLASSLEMSYMQRKKMQESVEKIKKENFDLIRKSREQAEEIESRKKQREVHMRALVAEPGKESVYDKMDKKIQELTVVNDVTQGLILGSGVHWMADDDAKELMINAGMPVKI